MVKGLRYQHRRNCSLITPFGDVELDEDGYVTNLDKFNPGDLLTIEGFADTDVFGGEPRPRPARGESYATSAVTAQALAQGPSDADYWGVIRELTEKGGTLNSEGYLQMEVLTAELRERDWPPISGTRRIRITDEGREREKAAKADPQPEANNNAPSNG